MYTSSSSPYGRGGSVLEVSLKGTPGQRSPWTHTTLDKEPLAEIPWRETPGQRPLYRESPGQRPTEQRTAWAETPQKEHWTRDTDPLERDTWK